GVTACSPASQKNTWMQACAGLHAGADGRCEPRGVSQSASAARWQFTGNRIGQRIAARRRLNAPLSTSPCNRPARAALRN
ncbi:hypothetical protein LN457_15590, partial [Xanthomonas phaseoli]